MSTQARWSRENAETVIANAWSSYGTHAFRVRCASPAFAALKAAERRGWCRWVAPDRCKLTDRGIVAVIQTVRVQP